MNNILISITLTILFFLPVIIGFFLFRRKRNFKIIAFSILINIIFAFVTFLLTLTILNPTQEFEDSRFKEILSTNFETQFPSNLKYIATQFKQEKGLLSCKYWTARVGVDEVLFNDFLKEIEGHGWGGEVNIQDETAGQMVRYNYVSRYMSGINYVIDFYEDNRTIRIYVIDCP